MLAESHHKSNFSVCTECTECISKCTGAYQGHSFLRQIYPNAAPI